MLSSVGLFAGVGGIELGLQRAGFGTELLCEIDPAAQRVLLARFGDVPVASDVRALRSLPKADVIAAGFPCQDLSQAGKTAGIGGSRSGLVQEVFRLISRRGARAPWLLVENVPFMLHLERGRAMRSLTDRLGELGYTWAYRVVDTRAFGLPQRRLRVILLASRTEDPRPILFSDEVEPTEPEDTDSLACGFYWTEGVRGLGWAVDAVPTLKGGSTIGIPSPPAVWMVDGSIATPDIRDAERLQGFPTDWTSPSVEHRGRKNGPRWKLVGNAVSVPVAEWIGRRLAAPPEGRTFEDVPLDGTRGWPSAAWGRGGLAHRVVCSTWPVRRTHRHLHEFLRHPTRPLSVRAAEGFLGRASRSSLHFPEGLLESVAAHAERVRRQETAA